MLLSVYVPVAVNCRVRPLAIEGLAGVTAIETRVAAVTVSVAAGLVMAPEDAVMLEVPAVTADASPEALIVATLSADEFQVAALVRCWVVLSE